MLQREFHQNENRKRQKEYFQICFISQHKISREFDEQTKRIFLIYVFKRNFLCFFWFSYLRFVYKLLDNIKDFFYELGVFL